MLRRRSLCHDYDHGPGGEYTVYLHRKNGDKKLTSLPKSRDQGSCIKRVVSWIKIANYTLDIGLFSIFHKKIISQLIKMQKRSVKCRVLVYRHMMLGEKRQKHQMYIENLKKAGIQVRWISESLYPCPMSRIVLIDCTDPTNRPVKFDNDGGLLYGDQTAYRTPHHITKDLFGLMVMKTPPDNLEPWCDIFEEMWMAVDSESECVPSDSEETQILSAGPSKKQ